MNTEFFIAKRITKESKSRFSRPMINIAISAIAISITVMILSISIVNGFKKNIIDKVIGFQSHIQITHFNHGNSYISEKISNSDSLIKSIRNFDQILNIQKFANKTGILKKEDKIHGVIIKGVGENFDFSFFEKNLIKGKTLNFNDSLISNKILVSKKICTKFKLNIGDEINIYFIQNPPRVKKFKIRGIYETGLSEMDELIIISDIKNIQKLNDWGANEIGGLEIKVKDFNKVDDVSKKIYETIDYNLKTKNIKEINTQIFDWLKLQDLNVKVIIFLMLIISLVNITTTLLILILERSYLIGLLKSIGANDWSIRKIFLFNSIYIITKGVILGNIFGILILLIQYYFAPFSLDETTYYMSKVPVDINFINILILNIITIVTCWIILIIPSYLIRKITPIKHLQFK